jgi:drug/metabolite transporter superfamily protein YnfA
MSSENMHASELADAVVARGAGGDEQLEIAGRYLVECWDRDGQLKWVDWIYNLVTTLGKNLLLDDALAGTVWTAFNMGLVDGSGAAPVYAATDTMAAHPGWIENTQYSQAALPPLTWAVAANGVKSTSAGCLFSITAAVTIAGCFVTTATAKGAATGTLLSAGSFSGGNKICATGDTLTVSYQMSL